MDRSLLRQPDINRLGRAEGVSENTTNVAIASRLAARRSRPARPVLDGMRKKMLSAYARVRIRGSIDDELRRLQQREHDAVHADIA